MLASIRRVEVPELGASLGRHLLRHPHLTCKLVEMRGIVADDRMLAPTNIPTSIPGWPVVTLVLEGEGLVRSGHRGERAAPRDLVWTPPGLDYRGRAGDSGSIQALLVQWDPSVFGAAPSSAADRARLGTRDFERLRAAVTEVRATGHDGTRSADAVAKVCAAMRALGLIHVSPTPGDLRMEVPATIARAGRIVDALLSTPGATTGSAELQMRLGRSPAQTRRLVDAYAGMLQSQGATGWRGMLRAWRLYVGMSLMTARDATTERVARLLGYGSPVAFCHAFARVGMPSPGAMSSLVRTLA